MCRFLLLMVAFKRPQVCRFYFYFEILISSLSALIPQHDYLNWDAAVRVHFTSTTLDFLVFYTQFRPSLVCLVVLDIFVAGVRSFVYEHTVYASSTDLFLAGGLIVMHLAVCCLIHAFIQRTGHRLV